MEKTRPRIDVKTMTKVAVVTALICVLAPFSIPIPISPVPLSLANFIIFLSVLILEWQWATLSTCLYLLIGLVGLPVFSGFSGGFGKLAGPTGGYLIGYIPLVVIAGLAIKIYELSEKKKRGLLAVYYVVGIILGEFVLYFLGTLWLSYSMSITFSEALFMAVVPYLPGDIIKMIIALLIGSQLRNVSFINNKGNA